MSSEKQTEVLVFTTPDCPYCAKAKEYLAAKGVPFSEADVSNNRNNAQEMARISGQNAIPVLIIKGRVVVGFNKDLIDDALERSPLPRRDVFMTNIIFDPFDT
ncbi:MAG: Uxx-star family glutaredoxin-like (seleno)protein [Candidatus Micrarchaeia archaeon]